ncbi:tetratricopeptide repeat (TPR)-/ U-box domain-containing protein [Cardiosporidium cionae]|uniref:E3 ubiquitin-protein ligase CHIP n=1 Tax=Cardiosporidium cionae TaxID=476202 RepID=A0ABQ7J8V4_9APIC|nr:tetratricopeptide repeat (TPR)-/ U-box domain-containing protein [Cardiosporidium cionae]|eukprot:KAF8820423.1 tetratricopeptide repeat (TPR)-/ U-box domain-containing protein [Cardiosporidium cionae]
MGGNHSSPGERPRFPSFRNFSNEFRSSRPEPDNIFETIFAPSNFLPTASNPSRSRRTDTSQPISPSSHPPKRRSTSESNRSLNSSGVIPPSTTASSRPISPTVPPHTAMNLSQRDDEAASCASAPSQLGGGVINPEGRTDDPQSRQLAETYKTNGNSAFKIGAWEEALSWYTKAIELDSTQPNYLTNRAFCYKRLNHWPLVVEDTRRALSLDDESVKAHYLLGQALVHLGDNEEGLKKLIKAKTLSSSGHYRFEDEIERTILETKHWIWEKKQVTKENLYTEVLSFFTKHGTYLKETQGKDMQEYFTRLSQLHTIVEDLKNCEKCFEVPSFLCCKISMSLMKDPVLTKSGVTYERAFIVEHLQRNGEFDPISRQRCKVADLIPNYAIKEATEYFLDNP